MMKTYCNFLLLAFSCGLAFSIESESPNKETIELGSTSIVGESVPISFPIGYPETKNLKTEFDRVQTKVLQEGMPCWKIRVFIETYSNIYEQNKNKVYRWRRSVLPPKAIKAIYASLAQFKALAETKSEGQVQLDFEISMEEDPLIWNINQPSKLITKEYLERRYGPMFNSSEFVTEDKVYRGPYHSIFVIHPTLTEDGDTYMVKGCPLSSISYFTTKYNDRKAGLALALYDQWFQHLNLRAQKAGYNIPLSRIDSTLGKIESPTGIIRKEMWKPICTLQEGSGKGFINRHYRTRIPIALSWKNVKDDPWGKLPKLDPKPFSDFLKSAVIPRSFLTKVDKDHILALHSNVIDAQYAQISPASSLGYIDLANQLYVLFKINENQFEVAKKIVQNLLNKETTSQDPLLYRCPGAFTHISQKNKKGEDVLRILEQGDYKSGYAKILEKQEIETLFNDRSNPIIKFWIKVDSRDPIALHFVSNKLSKDEILYLGPMQELPIEGADCATPFEAIPLPLNNKWQKVVLDLSKAGFSIENLEQIYVSPPKICKFIERQHFGKASIKFKGWGQAAAGEMSLLDQTLPLSSDEELLHQIAQIEYDIDQNKNRPLSPKDEKILEAALQHSKERIRLQGLSLASHQNIPESLHPYLFSMVKSATEIIAEVAAQAIAFQNTEAGKQVLAQTLQSGPFDHNRASAVKALRKYTDSNLASSICLMMTSRSPLARLEAVKSLGCIRNTNSMMMLMPMLYDPDPRIRCEVAKYLNPKFELVNRRLEWYAVNDPSETVRALCYIKLLQSPLKEYLEKGHLGVRDESLFVRLQLLRNMINYPNELHRNALRLAVTDTHANIRSAALYAFAKLPNAVESKEIENVFTDNDPRVQQALAHLTLVKSLKPYK